MYITTYTGRHFDPTNPSMALIRITDIAHSLSLICRANGQVSRFYSVAQHCIACATEAAARGLSARLQLACLLHDAGEAYLCDLPRPVKNLLADYIAAEDRLLDVIERKYLGASLSEEERALVRKIDDDMMSYEFHHLMAEEISDEWRDIVSQVRCRFTNFREVEEQYEKLAGELVAACRE